MLIKRKGAQHHKWEEVMEVPSTPECCPRSLLQKYVDLTQNIAAPGSVLLRALPPRYLPLKSQTIGSITKRLLSELGVPTNIFGAHSTRGAGVKMYKKFGLTSDQVVCWAR